MQRAVLVIKQGRSYLCQGCHWVYGDHLHKLLTTHFPTFEAARELVTGNRITDISESGEIERNTGDCPPLKLSSLKKAGDEECYTVHHHNGKEWTMREVRSSK